MKRSIPCLLAVFLLAAFCMPRAALAEGDAFADSGLVFDEEELVFQEKEPTIPRGEEEKSDLDKLNDANASNMGALGRKDWAALAAAVKLTGDWREDLTAIAQSQIGYDDLDGLTLYHEAFRAAEPKGWTALFISWAADQSGLTDRQFPFGDSYDGLRSAMNQVHAVKKISRSAYPTKGDLALLETDGQKLLGVIVYVSNGYASIIVGDDHGRVTRNTFLVGSGAFTHYVDLNVLMERAGIQVGKGGDVPAIPEGGVAAWTNTNAVYLREEPTTASKSLTTIKKEGAALLAVSAQMQEDGYIWYGVQYRNFTGYVRGDLLKLDMAAIAAASESAEALDSMPRAGSGSLKITQTGLREGESAILRVSVTSPGTLKTAHYTVLISAENPTAVIANVEIGAGFTVREDSAWAWNGGVKAVSVHQPYDTASLSAEAAAALNGTWYFDGSDEYVVTSSSNDRWLHDETAEKSTFRANEGG